MARLRPRGSHGSHASIRRFATQTDAERLRFALPAERPEVALLEACRGSNGDLEMTIDDALTKVQKFNVVVLAGMLALVLTLSTVHLGVMIGHDIMVPP